MSADVPDPRPPRHLGTTADDPDALRRHALDLEGKALPPGSCLGGRYTIESHLGAGGMGTVYAAHDAVADHPVALKFIHPELASDPRARKRIRSELKAALAVSHPNVARTHTLEELDGHTFLVMERLDGPTLAARMGQERVPWPEALALARGMLAGVAAAHQRGVVHRDIKPLNIKVCPDGRAVVMDFGLAVLHEQRTVVAPVRAQKHTNLGGGTPGYMAPEVAGGAPGDERADVYALGVTLYELFAGHSPLATADTVASDEPRPQHVAPKLRERSRDLPAWLDALLRDMLDGAPARRPANAGEVLRRLERDGRKARTRRVAAFVGSALATFVVGALLVSRTGSGGATGAAVRPDAAAAAAATAAVEPDAATATVTAPASDAATVTDVAAGTANVSDADAAPATRAPAPPRARPRKTSQPDNDAAKRRKRLYLDD